MTDNNWKVKINYVHIYVISTLDIQLLLFLFFFHFPFIATPFIKWNRVTAKGGEMQKGIFES